MTSSFRYALLKYIELLSVAQQRAAQQVSHATTSNNYLSPSPSHPSAA